MTRTKEAIPQKLVFQAERSQVKSLEQTHYFNFLSYFPPFDIKIWGKDEREKMQKQYFNR